MTARTPGSQCFEQPASIDTIHNFLHLRMNGENNDIKTKKVKIMLLCEII